MILTLLGKSPLAVLALLAAFQNPAPAPAPTPPPAPPGQKPDAKPDAKPEEKPVLGPEDRRLRDPKEALRIGGVPSADKEAAAKRFAPVALWISKHIERPVDFVPVADAAEAVAGLASAKLDLIWVDAVSAVQAEQACKGRCQPILAREEDIRAKSYFVANKKIVVPGRLGSVAERKPMALEQLAALKPKLAELSFAFGPKSSTSGHIMARYFLEHPEVAISPEKGFRQVTYAPQAEAVLASVASGAVEAGVAPSAAWEALTDAQKLEAPVFFVTPEFTESVIVVHSRTGPAMPLRIMKAYFALTDPSKEDQKAVLDAYGTKKFVPVGASHLEPVRQVVKSASERKLL